MLYYRSGTARPGSPVPDGELYDAGHHSPEHLPRHWSLHPPHTAPLCHLPSLLWGQPQKVPTEVSGLRNRVTLCKLEYHRPEKILAYPVLEKNKWITILSHNSVSMYMIWMLLDFWICMSLKEYMGYVKVFSSPELKAQVSFLITCRLSVCPSVCKLFTFSSSSQEPWGQFQLNMAQSILGWRGFKFVKKKGPALFQGEIIMK